MTLPQNPSFQSTGESKTPNFPQKNLGELKIGIESKNKTK
jgi:hypothetical protein